MAKIQTCTTQCLEPFRNETANSNKVFWNFQIVLTYNIEKSKGNRDKDGNYIKIYNLTIYIPSFTEILNQTDANV
jgi:hypothetical protein